MRGLVLAVLAAGLALAGCTPQGPQASGPLCAKPVDRLVSFTSAQPKDRLVVEALGPDCSNPAMFARIYDPAGRLVFAEVTSGKDLMNLEMFPPDEGTAQGVVNALYDIGGPNALNLPAWQHGPAPAPGNYGAYEAMVPQAAYERLRQLNGPTLIKRGGGESGTVYVYDPVTRSTLALAKFAV